MEYKTTKYLNYQSEQYNLINKFFNKKRKDFCAGILPFCIKNKTVYVLLGKDTDNKWSDFGGRSEPTDNGRWDLTAAREFYEETIGSVMDVNTVLLKLQMRKKLRIEEKTHSGCPYYLYILNIPYRETHRYNFKSTLSFIKHIGNIEHKYFEKTDIQWITLDTLKKSIETENTEYPLRNIFKRTLLNSIAKIENFINAFSIDE